MTMPALDLRALLGAALLLLGVAVLLLTTRLALRLLSRSVRRLHRGVRVRYPLVLVHGVLGFDSVSIAGTTHDYFRGIAEALSTSGVEVHALRLPPTAAIAARAEQLAAAVRALAAPRVNIIAHSMGGLDSRFAITKLGLDDKVAALITIGTPHHGTPLADLGTEVLGERLGLRKMIEALAVDIEAFYDLTTTRMAAFNAQVRNSRRVYYGSYVGVCPNRTRINPILLPSHFLLTRSAGDNDGIVPASSQAWGEVLGRVVADHWAQIGWGRDVNIAATYLEMARELAARGY